MNSGPEYGATYYCDGCERQKVSPSDYSGVHDIGWPQGHLVIALTVAWVGVFLVIIKASIFLIQNNLKNTLYFQVIF